MATSTTKTTTPPHHLSNAIQLHPTHIAGAEKRNVAQNGMIFRFFDHFMLNYRDFKRF